MPYRRNEVKRQVTPKLNERSILLHVVAEGETLQTPTLLRLSPVNTYMKKRATRAAPTKTRLMAEITCVSLSMPKTTASMTSHRFIHGSTCIDSLVATSSPLATAA